MEGTDKKTLKDAEVAARALGVRLQVVEARGPAELQRVYADMTRERANALVVLGTPCYLPSESGSRAWRSETDCRQCSPRGQFVEVGGLMADGASLTTCCAVPRPTWTGCSRVQSPASCLSSSHQVRVGDQLEDRQGPGLTIPQSVLGRADEVIQ
jgi:hypothetical protein